MAGKNNVAAASSGTLWFVGWLFTIGYVHLTGWKILFSLLLWPYYLGEVIRGAG
jgi:hypothetical protein